MLLGKAFKCLGFFLLEDAILLNRDGKMQKNVNPYRSRFWQGTTNGTVVFYPALHLISSEYSASKWWYPLWASSAAEGEPRLSSCMSWAQLSASSGKKADSSICLVLCAWTLCNTMREFWPLHALMGSWVQFRPHSPVQFPTSLLT